MLHHFHMSGPTQPVGSLPWGLWEGAGWRAWCTLDWDAWKAESRAVDKAVLIDLFCAYWCMVRYFVYQHFLPPFNRKSRVGLWIADINFGGGSCDIKDHYWQGGYTAISEQLCPVSHQCSKAQEISGDHAMWMNLPCNSFTCALFFRLVLPFLYLWQSGKRARWAWRSGVSVSFCNKMRHMTYVCN